MNKHHPERKTRAGSKPAEPEREPLPISKASGGMMPGIDLTSFSALEEMDDLEYVRRMRRRGVL